MNVFDTISKYFEKQIQSRGWCDVWERNYFKIRRAPLEDRRVILKKLRRRFGPNHKWNFEYSLTTPNHWMSKLPKFEPVPPLIIPFNYEEKK